MSLQEIKSKPIDLSIQQLVNEKDQGGTISGIYSEDRKESEIFSLDQESRSKTREYQSKSDSFLADYLTAKKKLISSREGASRRLRRSVSPKNTSTLTKNERKAIWEMYKLYEKVEKERKGLIPKLEKIDENIVVELTPNNRPNKSVLESHLEQMKWTTQESVQYENNPPRVRIGQRHSPTNIQYWNVWDNNPFRSFMNETEYKSLMDKIKQTQAEKIWRGRSDFLRRGMRGYLSPSEKTRRQEEIAQQAKEKVTNTVALKFLEWMKQS